MKLYILPAILVLLIAAACNNDDNKHAGHNGSGKEPQTLADSLMKDIDDGHIVGMSKMGKLHNTKKEVQRIRICRFCYGKMDDRIRNGFRH